jgi:hypothetical protein
MGRDIAYPSRSTLLRTTPDFTHTADNRKLSKARKSTGGDSPQDNQPHMQIPGSPEVSLLESEGWI